MQCLILVIGDIVLKKIVIEITHLASKYVEMSCDHLFWYTQCVYSCTQPYVYSFVCVMEKLFFFMHLLENHSVRAAPTFLHAPVCLKRNPKHRYKRKPSESPANPPLQASKRKRYYLTQFNSSRYSVLKVCIKKSRN